MSKNANKEKALASLLTQPSVRAAAKESGVSETCLYRYLRDEQFAKDYRDRRREMVEVAVGAVQQISDEAAATLRKNLHCGKPAVEIRAASILLDVAIRGVELGDILQRLEVLENGLNQQS